MHKLTFYPLGNADCCLIELEGEGRILFDYADTRDPEDDEDLRCDLPTLLREKLKSENRDYFNVVAITHLDEDHYKGASELFWLDHAEKYQGEDRVKIETLWVPAAAITEASLEKAEAKILQEEARYRLKKGHGIRVFSRPARLREWCEANEVSLDDRLDLITDAGQLVPEFTLEGDGVEFFVHSPFAKRLNDDEVEDRNEDAIVVQATFSVEDVQTRVLLLADVTHEVLSDIVAITRDMKERPERLAWDIAELPHHCSYLALGTEKGEDKTQPGKSVDWLWREQGQEHGIIVSTSNPIPVKGSDEDDDVNPPHRQAANYYREVLSELSGELVVTMQHPNASSPRPYTVEIGKLKANPDKSSLSASDRATTGRTPRAG
jgi:hypothetical protein